MMSGKVPTQLSWARGYWPVTPALSETNVWLFENVRLMYVCVFVCVYVCVFTSCACAGSVYSSSACMFLYVSRAA